MTFFSGKRLPFYFCGLLTIAVHSTRAQYNSTTEAKINQLIKQMTLKEKVNMIHASSSFTSGGVPRLGIPELTMSDGPHGVRMEHGRGWTEIKADDSCTYLPTGITLASTWNPHLGYAFGAVLGSEAKYRGKDVILGPGICVIRTPLNGRNFEYLSEDPYLISQMAVGYIRGVQAQGIAACVKHYLANNQETRRDTIDVEMSERALREIYMPGFKAAVQKGGVYTVMGAYNRFRGQFCTHNAYLVNTVLKREWGFKGILMSDWGAVHNTLQALENGTDLEMGTDLSMLPHPDYHKFFMADTVISLVKSGAIPLSLINDKVRRILRVMYRVNKFGGRTPGSFNTKAHEAVALKVAEEGIVLLKNDDHILPFHKTAIRTIAVIGENAERKNAGAGGSSQVPAKYEITPLEGLKRPLGDQGHVRYAPGYRIARGAGADPGMIDEAVKAATGVDAVIIIGGWTHGYSDAWNDNAYDAEGVDKPNLDMPFGQDALINAVLRANPKTVVVLMGGGPVDMSSWIGKVKGIIQAWYPGMEGGTALAKIIFGEVNPSGKLPMTFPKKLADCPAQVLGEYPGKFGVEHYFDGIYVGYRYYDTYKVEPQFCFGHGLSYTTFKYEGLHLTKRGHEVTVRLAVKNTGRRAGAEVVQLYVEAEHPSIKRPEKELKAFQKVFLQPGEIKQVILTLHRQAFQYYDEEKQDWATEPGRYDILIGSSSRDIRLSGKLTL